MNKVKMRKLVGLAFTYCDDASSETEFLTASHVGKAMIVKEINCPTWVAPRILEILAKKEVWLPSKEKAHLHIYPSDAIDVFKKSLQNMNIEFTIKDYGLGGVSFIPIKRRGV